MRSRPIEEAAPDYGLPTAPPPGSSLVEWKEHVRACQARILELQRERRKGWFVSAAQAHFVDDLIVALLNHIETEYFHKYPRVDSRLAFVAQGGYGRSEMSPRSDLDLLFIFPQRSTPYVEFVSEKMLYTLWDLGFQVGHATRSIRDCVKFGQQDMTVRTALLDHRFVAGDRTVYDELVRALQSDLLFENPTRYVREKLAEAEQRHSRFGNSTNVVEPHVKEGEGSLRDLHTALWVSKVKFRVDDFYGLFQKGLLPRSDLQALERGWDFLLRVRHELHLRTHKKHDIINFELTAPIAEALGFKDRGGTLAAEALMQRYYYHARMILHITRGIIERCMEDGRLRGVFGRLGIRELGHGFRTYRKELIVSENSLRDHPVNILRAFRFAQQYKVPFTRDAHELLRRYARKIDADFRVNPEAAGIFLDIAGDPEGVAEIFLQMNDTRVLGQYLPEFGKQFCRMQYQLYHRYTVDVHSCFCVREIERLLKNDSAMPEQYRAVAARLPDPQLMVMASLLHDVGKGRGGDHSIIGARLVKRIGRRLGLNARRTDRLSLLVRHHLTMNAVAQRRDIHDSATINDFAQDVGDLENLDMLYLLSFADARAVGPNVWNEWKSSLLTELYDRTRWVLETGDYKGKWIKKEVRERKAAIRTLAEKAKSDLPLDVLMDSVPDRYFLNNSPDEVLRHLKLMPGLEGKPFIIEQRELENGAYEVVFLGYDRPGLFSFLAGSFRACDLTVLDAQINTLNDGRVFDIYRVAPAASDKVSASRWGRVRDILDGALAGTLDLEQIVREKGASILGAGAQKQVRVRNPRIEINNELSPQFTIIDIFAYDRIGILYDITRVLTSLGLSIHLAKVATAADMVADVFYVNDVSGAKVTDAVLLDRLSERILAVITDPTMSASLSE